MGVLRSLLTAGVLASGLLWAISASATPQMAEEASKNGRWQVTQQRNPDNACLDCHKPDKEGMHGTHAEVINPNNNLPVTCTNCHGKPGPNHREGVKDVMRFNEPMYSVEQQNSVCLSCHLPEQLQKAFWPHDVHVTKLACASCHDLHPKQDMMKELNDKGKVKICVDCHSDQRDNPNFNPAAVNVLKEQP
ncbi:cytochrome c nitrite reductase pentaheme subunit [Providencia alcalifaciens]|uniref:cytochrome c nitrite reductase pentaheme subunit n=1 Tax=Providencia alcalifaciens TaxID=126385 RepID=UPI0015CFCE80|nr:cytochrome c nitrite reductase pentaheme subunit [Providencia alcalifaciens]MBF0692529.1 cytochrome c nitrite reductase pentaheme subunit [Providencia alcalifaciens]NYS91033.1 cytochrome c nitrite reductase pentaheme subunit [Providencia alcalifaciens]